MSSLSKMIQKIPRSRKRVLRIYNNLKNLMYMRLHQRSHHFMRMEYAPHDLYLKVTGYSELNNRAYPLGNEPNTVKWIESLDSNWNLVDVGANVGIFSLIAAQFHAACGGQMKVYAFEPHPGNFAALQENISRNNLGDRMFAMNMALTQETRLVQLYHSQTEYAHESGSSNHQVETTVDAHGDDFNPSSKTWVQGMSLDHFSNQYHVPIHAMKIDVDGLELEVLRGAETLLRNPDFQSLQVEINPGSEQEVLDFLKDCNLELIDVYENRNHLYQRAKQVESLADCKESN
jgi:FkbM family methyltransferase